MRGWVGACESALSFQVAESNCCAVCRRGCETVLTATMSVVPHTHSGAGTSGGELEEESWKPPDAELIQKLVSQIEYYLSDENLEHDAFLLKHVRRNKLGFVSVKLLTSFKKVTAAPTHNLLFFCFFSGKTQQLCTCLSNTTQDNITHCRPDAVALQAQAVRHTSSLCSCSPLISARRLILPCAARR